MAKLLTISCISAGKKRLQATHLIRYNRMVAVIGIRLTEGNIVSDTITAKGVTVDLSAAEWRKSTKSGPYSDNCVEVAFVGGVIAVRDSKNPAGAALIFTTAEWDAFVGGAKDGEFDL